VRAGMAHQSAMLARWQLGLRSMAPQLNCEWTPILGGEATYQQLIL